MAISAAFIHTNGALQTAFQAAEVFNEMLIHRVSVPERSLWQESYRSEHPGCESCKTSDLLKLDWGRGSSSRSLGLFEYSCSSSAYLKYLISKVR